MKCPRRKAPAAAPRSSSIATATSCASCCCATTASSAPRRISSGRCELGYDYIVIDEITAAPDFRDGATLNRRLRKLLLRMPARTIIPYIRIDLIAAPGRLRGDAGRAGCCCARSSGARARSRSRSTSTRPRSWAAPRRRTFRRAADRLALVGQRAREGRRHQPARDQRRSRRRCTRAFRSTATSTQPSARPRLDHAPGQRDPPRQQAAAPAARPRATTS